MGTAESDELIKREDIKPIFKLQKTSLENMIAKSRRRTDISSVADSPYQVDISPTPFACN